MGGRARRLHGTGITVSLKGNPGYQQCLEHFEQRLDEADLFYGHGTDNPRDEAGWLLDAVLRRRGEMLADAQTPISAESLAEAEALLEQRVRERRPLAYLLREAWFCGLPFYVDERVLVPRSPIAELLMQDFEPFLAAAPPRILDLCCGSGCIGIACALVFEDARVDLADLSADALAVAAINRERYELGERVRLIPSDLFGDLGGERYDLIVSNPPYVGEDEYAELPDEYLAEPRLGLVTDEQGLAIPRRILHRARRHLNSDGLLILEVGNNWQALEEAEPGIPFLWLDFEHGGHGVCALRASDLPA